MHAWLGEIVGWLAVTVIAVSLILTGQPIERWQPLLCALIGYLIPSPLSAKAKKRLIVEEKASWVASAAPDSPITTPADNLITAEGALIPHAVRARPPIPTRVKQALRNAHVQRAMAFLLLLSLTTSWSYHPTPQPSGTPQTSATRQPDIVNVTGDIGNKSLCLSCWARDLESRPCLDARTRPNLKAIRVYEAGTGLHVFPLPVECKAKAERACHMARTIIPSVCALEDEQREHRQTDNQADNQAETDGQSETERQAETDSQAETDRQAEVNQNASLSQQLPLDSSVQR